MFPLRFSRTSATTFLNNVLFDYAKCPKDKKPCVSILIPVYNSSRYLETCLESVANQELHNIEIICLDDGSIDDSPSILDSFAQRDSRVRVIHKQNEGYGRTMNLGLSEAHGEYIGIVESDDFASPHMFARLYAYAKRHKLDLVKSNYFAHSSHGDTIVEPFSGFPQGSVFNPADIPNILATTPCIWTGLYRRGLIEAAGVRFNESPGASYQDTSFVHQIWMCAHRVAILPESYLHYRTDNSASSVKSSSKVYAVCDEYNTSERFMRAEEGRIHAFCSALNLAKLKTYRWNYSRISADYRLPFLEKAAKEFCESAQRGTLQRSLFSEEDWAILNELMSNPSAFAAHHPDSF